MPKYKTKIWPGGNRTAGKIDVTVEANNSQDAKKLLEAQYGKGSIATTITTLSR